MTTSLLPTAFALSVADKAALARGFAPLAQDIDLCASDTLLGTLPTESGCYLWLLRHKALLFKLYLGRTRSIRRRVANYCVDFQLHSPNDFKLRFFHSLMTEWWPTSTLDLYFAAYPEADLKKQEKSLIQQFRPLINSLPAPTDKERAIVRDAFGSYYRSVVGRMLRTPNQGVQ